MSLNFSNENLIVIVLISIAIVFLTYDSLCSNRLIQLSTNTSTSANIDSDVKKVSLDTNTKLVHVECLEFDKYGRLLVNIYEKDSPISLSYNDILVNEGFAKKYNGGTKDEFTY